MVTSAGLFLVAIAALGVDERVPSEPVSIYMVAVEARNEGRSQQHFGPGLERVRRSLAGLSYDSFYKVQSAEVPTHYGQEQRILVNERYTLCVEPVSVRDDGRIRLHARVEMKSRDGTHTVNVLDTTLLLTPGANLNLGGMRLEKGELIIVMSVR